MPAALRYFLRTSIFFPVLTTTASLALVWQFLLTQDRGIVNYLLQQIGLEPIPWLSSSTWALPSVMIYDVWKSCGYLMVIYLAGLQSIGDSIIDAAKLDGAVGLRRMINIDLPLIMGQVRLLGILAMIGGIQGFGAQLVLTRGGPGYATMVPGMWMYETAFNYSRMGYASAIGTSMFIIILGLTIMIMRSVQSSTEHTAA